MKRIKSLTCCLMALTLALCLCSCGEESTDEIGGISDETASFGSVPASDSSGETMAGESSASDGRPASGEMPTAEPVQGIEFPYALDDGKLLVTCLFQSSIMNPDCDLEEGENIATLEIINQSEECLSVGSFEATMPDGRVLHFTATDIPPGAKVWAFELSNQSIETEEPCISLTVASQYEADNLRMPDGISVEVDGISVTLTNLSEEPITNLTAFYHDCFEDAFFGGVVYSCFIDELPAGGTEMIEANDCFLGDAEVVRVTMEGDS